MLALQIEHYKADPCMDFSFVARGCDQKYVFTLRLTTFTSSFKTSLAINFEWSTY